MNDFPEKIKVLLVDDDEEDYILTKYLFDDFKDKRYALDWTDDGAKALDCIKSGAYDIYFVDYRLGEYNGLEILREAISASCLAPIILMTGQGDAEVDDQAMKAGAADYLVKGEIDAPLLERIIRYSLQQAHSIEKIQSSESKFRSVIQTASDGIFLVDENGLIRLWNTAAEKIFGYTKEEIIGQPATSLMGLPLGQGYLFSKPMNTEFAEKFLKKGLSEKLFSNENFAITQKEGETFIELENYQ